MDLLIDYTIDTKHTKKVFIALFYPENSCFIGISSKVTSTVYSVKFVENRYYHWLHLLASEYILLIEITILVQHIRIISIIGN